MQNRKSVLLLRGPAQKSKPATPGSLLLFLISLRAELLLCAYSAR